MRRALERLYQASTGERGPRHHLLVATDQEAELCDQTVVPAAHAAQCLAPHAMILPMEGWEGQQRTQTSAAPLMAHYVDLGCSEFVYLDRTVERFG